MDIKNTVKQNKEYLRNIRNFFHTNPELSMQETNTIAKIKSELDSFGLTYVDVSEGGLISVIEFDNPGKTLLMRADIDALPMQESKTNLKGERECCSIIDGVMHSCGHDAHAAMQLAAIKIMCENKEHFSGRIVAVFERGEEVDGGVVAILKELQKEEYDIDGAYAVHLYARVKEGQISAQPGPRMAGLFSFKYEIVGRGGHGSRGDLCISPIDVFTDFYQNMQYKMAMRRDPFTPVTFSIGMVQSGRVENIIEDTLTFAGTIRISDFSRIGEFWAKELDKTLYDSCNKFGAKFNRLVYTPIDTAPVNNKICSEIAENAIKKQLGDEGVGSVDPWMGSECFGLYLKCWPGILGFVGISNEEQGFGADHHNDKFDVSVNALMNGVQFALQYAKDFCQYSGDFAFTSEELDPEKVYTGEKYKHLWENNKF